MSLLPHWRTGRLDHDRYARETALCPMLSQVDVVPGAISNGMATVCLSQSLQMMLDERPPDLRQGAARSSSVQLFQPARAMSGGRLWGSGAVSPPLSDLTLDYSGEGNGSPRRGTIPLAVLYSSPARCPEKAVRSCR